MSSENNNSVSAAVAETVPVETVQSVQQVETSVAQAPQELVEELTAEAMQQERESIEDIQELEEDEAASGLIQGEEINEPVPSDDSELKQVDDSPAASEPVQTWQPIVIRTKSPKAFKAVLKGIGTLCDEATLVFSPEGMTFRGMDPSHIALVDVDWPNMAFERYDVDHERKVGVRVDELSKILSDFDDKHDSLKLGISDDNMLVIDNGNGSIVKSRLIESSASSTPLPKLNFNAKVILTSKLLDNVLKSVSKVSEYLTVSSNYLTRIVTIEGRGDSGEICKKIEPGFDGFEDAQIREDSKATFSLDYMTKIHKAMKGISDFAVLEYSSKMPVRVEYRIENTGRLHFYLAPRVQD